jgi:hypothetical protein
MAATIAMVLCAYLAVLPVSGLGWVPNLGPRWLVDSAGIGGNWWLSWMGIPVGVLGAIVYGVVLLVLPWTRPSIAEETQSLAWRVLTLMALIFGGASLWFLSLERWVADKPCPACELVQLAGLVTAGALLFRGPVRLRRHRMAWPDPIKIRRFATGILGLIAGFALMVIVVGQVILSPRPGDALAAESAPTSGDVAKPADANSQALNVDGQEQRPSRQP